MSYTMESVHEGYISHSKKEIGTITNIIWQFPYKNTEEVMHKANRYSSLGVTKLEEKRVRGSVFKAFFAFLMFFLHFLKLLFAFLILKKPFLSLPYFPQIRIVPKGLLLLRLSLERFQRLQLQL